MSKCLFQEKKTCRTICKRDSKKNLIVALAGNPNSGKTTLFNSITGARQHVGNYPGVTVEKKEGLCKFKNRTIQIVDLPGTYSLTDFSPEEIVARNFIIDGKTDIIVDVIDSSNLERNLYLAIQLIETEKPVILSFNMMDEAEAKGYKIDIESISKALNVPVLRTVASKSEGIENLINIIINPLHGKNILRYSEKLEQELEKLTNFIKEKGILKNYSSRWISIKLLEYDKEIIEKLEFHEELIEIAEKSREYLKNFYGKEAEYIISEERYKFIKNILKKNLICPQEEKILITEKIDNIMTNRFLGIPIFILSMWLMFHITFTLGSYPMEWIENLVALIGNGINYLFKDRMLKSLLVDGITGGVGNVLIFLPNIIILFFVIALLEDTGYMARIAFIMDKIMHKIGIHGKAFIPLIIGFGCTVPAVMATRTIDSKKNRLITIFILPFMSCSAKLPVYSLFISAFFTAQIAGTVMFSIYFSGIILSVIMASILSKYMFPEETSFFIMELPPYRIPTLKTLLLHTWERSKLYLQKAGTFILICSIIIWFITSFPVPEKNKNLLEGSYAGQAGKLIEPLIRPLGLDWKSGIALVSGLAAKEVVISTIGTIYNLEEVDENSISLKEAIKKDNNFSPLKAISLLLFVLLYMPCLSAMSVIYKETGIKYTLFILLYTTGIAWFISFIVYQGGTLLGIE